MHDDDITGLDTQARLALPFLEVGGGIHLVIANAQSFEVNHYAWANQFVQGDTANILAIGDKVQGSIKVCADMQGRSNVLPTHLIKGHPFNPLDGRAIIGGKTWGVYIPVL